MNEKMYVYDNTISARTYISYIAEQAGGFAIIGRDGKLYIRTIGESTAELPLKYFQDYKWGEKFKVSRVRYEDGVQVFEKGDETNNTVYINQENMYISKQAQIDSIYDNLNNLEVYSFEGNSIIDPALDIGDILIIDGKKVLYQGSSQYGGKFKANISSKIQGKAKEQTTVRVPSQRTINRRVESRINEAEGSITQLVEETSEFEGKITEVEQTVDSITQKVENIQEFSREISSMQELHLVDTAEEENLVLNLTIYGDTEKFKVLTPEVDLLPSEDLVPYGDTIDLIVDTQPRSNPSATAQTFEIAMKEPLRNIGQVRDELNIINNKVIITKRIKQVFEKICETFEKVTYDYETHSATYWQSDYIEIEELMNYTATFDYDTNYLKSYCIFYYDENKKYLTQKGISGTTCNFTSIEKAKYIKIFFRFLDENTVDDIYVNSISIIEKDRTNGELYVRDNEVVEELGEIIIPTYKDNTYIYIREYPTLEYYCKYIIDNDYIDTFATQVQLNTEIKQTNSAIEILAEKKVDEDRVLSAIFVSPEKIQIEGNRINLKGTVTANENFKILDDGSMEAKNGKFTGGTIDLIQDTNSRDIPQFSVAMSNNTQKCEIFPSGFIIFDDYSQGYAKPYIDMYVGSKRYGEYDGCITISDSNAKNTIITSNIIMSTGDITIDGEVHASGFNNISTVEIKENINKLNIDALNIINNSDIYEFNYQKNKKSKTIGLIIGEGYKTPKEVVSNSDAINMYSMNSLAWKAIQELSQKISALENEIKELKK